MGGEEEEEEREEEEGEEDGEEDTADESSPATSPAAHRPRTAWLGWPTLSSPALAHEQTAIRRVRGGADLDGLERTTQLQRRRRRRLAVERVAIKGESDRHWRFMGERVVGRVVSASSAVVPRTRCTRRRTRRSRTVSADEKGSHETPSSLPIG